MILWQRERRAVLWAGLLSVPPALVLRQALLLDFQEPREAPAGSVAPEHSAVRISGDRPAGGLLDLHRGVVLL